MEGTSSSNEKNIHLRHACAPKWLFEVNENLTREQKNQIDVTPFKWVLNMLAKLEISGVLLHELVTRWDERSGDFKVRGRVVPFMPIDICLAIGLPVVGERVPADDDVNCYTSSLFEGFKVTVDEIVKRLTVFEEEVGDFCRMYILLAFGEFYFPRSGNLSFTSCIKLLDDLESLNSFNWGLAVYDFLVDSLSKTARAVKDGKNLSQIHLCGCAAILMEEEEEEKEIMPPHEYLTKKLTLSLMLSCSVLEGVGRTLKGRDWHQVRNAVLHQTASSDFRLGNSKSIKTLLKEYEV